MPHQICILANQKLLNLVVPVLLRLRKGWYLMSHTPGPYVFDAAFFESSKSLVTMKVVMEDNDEK